MVISKNQGDYNRAVQEISKVYLNYSGDLDNTLRRLVTVYLYECIQDRKLQKALGKIWNNSEIIRRCWERL